MGVCSGVEFAFMCTTTKQEVAVQCVGGSNVGIVFGIKLCMKDRGAGLSWLSQYHYYQAGGGHVICGPRQRGTVLEIKLGMMICGGVVLLDERHY